MLTSHGNDATTTETPDGALPTEIGEVDALRLQLLTERAVRLQAQLQLLQAQHHQTTEEYERVKAEAQRVTTEVWARYRLGPEDTYNNATRQIQRKRPAQHQ